MVHSTITKTKDAYNRIAPYFAATRKRLWPEFDQFRPYLRDGQRILDWGCGSGRMLMFLNRWKGEYYGLDISTELLAMARRNAQEWQPECAVHFLCTASRQPSFKANYFDLQFLIASFHHLPTAKTRLALLKKLYSWCKPGGHICITVWNLDTTWAKETGVKKGWENPSERDFLIPWRDQQGQEMCKRYYHAFTTEELSGLVSQAGFMVESVGHGEKQWSDDKGGRNLLLIGKK